MKINEERDFKNKKKLIASAIKEFSNNSFRESSLNRIIEKAEVSKGSFYFHFKSKKELYIHIFRKVAEEKKSFLERSLASREEKIRKMDFFEILGEYAKAGAKFSMKYPEYSKIGYRFYREKGNEIYDSVKGIFTDEIENSLEPLIDIAIKKGEFRKDFDRDFIISLFNGLLNNFDRIFIFKEKGKDFIKMASVYEKYIDFIKHGLSAKK